MKKRVLIAAWTIITTIAALAQVTQINSNKSLQVIFPLSNSKAIVVSNLDHSIWVTDGTLSGTVQISPDIKFEASGGLLSGQLVFRGSTLATGSEIYITDGTTGGTKLVDDIYVGPSSSAPGDFIMMNGFIYFSAVTAAEGRELWRTNGTLAGTTLVKAIVPGTDSSNNLGQYHMYTNGSFLLFAAQSAGKGVELWKSDGTDAGTNLLIDINTGNSGADSSNPANFYTLNNSTILFTAKDAATGTEVYKTDGSFAGTKLLMDINPGPASSTELDLGLGPLFPPVPLFLGFHTFNGNAYFQASDGSNTGELWSTDGTPANTTLIKEIVSGTNPSFIAVFDAVNYPGKFIFPVSDLATRSELWESDGTPGGTVLFKSFTPPDPGVPPAILLPYFGDILNGNFTQAFFQGNKFFFTAGTAAEGYELWLSDGTIGATAIVKDINTGAASGFDQNSHTYIYTSTALYFPANNGVNGSELWKSDGTAVGTDIVADIVAGSTGSNPQMSGFIVSGRILFEADNGDRPGSSPAETDLYAVDGSINPLPISLADFTVVPVADDAILNWHTLQEINTKNFTIQRSFDGGHFDSVGTVAALGNSSTLHGYTFTDVDIISSGKSILYYRLLSTDIDGKQAYSDVVSLKLKPNQWNVRLLTNPVLGDARVVLTGTTGEVQFVINDLNGKPVYNSKRITANATISIPVTNLPHGVYVLVVINGDNKKSIRFVK